MLKQNLIKSFSVLFIFLTLNLVITPSALAMASMGYFSTRINEDAKSDAQKDADMVDTQIWFLAGCLGGVVGLIIAHAVEPKPSATALLGKSPEYIATYTDTYVEMVKKNQTKTALNGCIAGTLLTIGLYAIILVAATNSEDDY